METPYRIIGFLLKTPEISDTPRSIVLRSNDSSDSSSYRNWTVFQLILFTLDSLSMRALVMTWFKNVLWASITKSRSFASLIFTSNSSQQHSSTFIKKMGKKYSLWFKINTDLNSFIGNNCIVFIRTRACVHHNFFQAQKKTYFSLVSWVKIKKRFKHNIISVKKWHSGIVSDPASVFE